MSETPQPREASCDGSGADARPVQDGESPPDYLTDAMRELVTEPSMAEIVDRAWVLAAAGGGTSRAAVRAAVRAGRDQPEN